MPLRIMVSRHSAFYSPLIATMSRVFLNEAGLETTYAILAPGQRSQDLVREGAVDIMQSAPSSNFAPLDRGDSPLPVHFALINRRDGFFLAARHAASKPFAWQDLEGRTLLADHGGQPLAMLRYAVHYNATHWSKIHVLDRGTPDEMMAAFRAGEGDYIHLQAPGPQLLEEAGVATTVVSVGASMPEVAFSTLCCSRDFLGTPKFNAFVGAYLKARDWVRTAPAADVAMRQSALFPGIAPSALAAAVARYQQLGSWSGGIEVTPALYEQALNVFEFSGGLRKRHPWDAVCVNVTTL